MEHKELTDAIMMDNLEDLIIESEKIPDISQFIISIQIHDPNSVGSSDVDPNRLIPQDGLTLLHVAAYYNSLDCFLYLHKKKGIELCQKSVHSFLPIHYACWNGSTEVALYILSQSPSQALVTVEGYKDLPLIYCAVVGRSVEIINELFKNGINLSDQNLQQKLIQKAIYLQDGELLKVIYDHCNLNNNGLVGYPPVMKSVISKNPFALELLYHGKNDIIYNSDNLPYVSLIGLICENDPRKLFKPMLIKILDDAKDMNLEPPIENSPGLVHWACQYMDLDIARKIIRLPGFNINRVENGKSGPSRLVNKKEEIVCDLLQLMLDHGFKVNLGEGSENPTLLESFTFAIGKNYPAIELLVNSGANIDAIISKTINTNPQSLYDFVMSTNYRDKKVKEIYKSRHD